THPPTREPLPIPRRELFGKLAAVVQPLYRDEGSPLSPGRVVADLAAAIGDGGLVVADPGPAGFWVARAFPTSELGSVLVPATVAPGLAAAAAVAAKLRLPQRRVVAVTAAPLDPAAERLIEEGRRLGVGFLLEVWGDEGVTSADEHADAVALALEAGE